MTMIRSEVLKSLIPVISDQFVVCNIGLPSQELHQLDDQPTNFYMLGTMVLLLHRVAATARPAISRPMPARRPR